MSTLPKIIAALCVVGALILGLLAYRMLMRPPPPPPPVVRTQVPVASHPVVVATKAIPAGQKVEAGAVKVEQWPVVPTGAFEQTAPVVGKFVRYSVNPGEPVTANQLVRGISTYLKPGERAVAVPVDELIGAGNRVQPGDLVDVFFTVEKGNEVAGSQSRLLQSRVRVLSYGSQTVDGPDTTVNATNAGNRGNTPTAARTALLAVPVDKVNELVLATRAGRLLLTLRSPEDSEVADAKLFPSRAPVLSPRKDLDAQQKRDAADDINMAYAGDSLVQLGGPQPVTEPKAKPPETQHAGRSEGGGIQVIRGDRVETMH